MICAALALFPCALGFSGGPPVIGDRLAAFTVTRQGGEPYSWQPGRVTVLCFCAFWCDTWKTQLPRVGDASEALRGLPVDFLTLSVDGRWSELGQKAAVGVSLSDEGGSWCDSIGIDRVPYTLLVDRNGVIRWASSGVVRSDSLEQAARACLDGVSSGGTVYLTFDDYPAPEGSDDLLDVLRADGVPATLFCVCSRLDAHAAEVTRAVREGNELEIHAWIHDEPTTDLARCRSALVKYGGDGSLYRPASSEYVLDTASMKRMSLHVDNPYDFQRPGVDELIRRISGAAQPGCVIQLHAGVEDTVQALPRIIRLLRDRGFTFAVLPHVKR